MYIPLYDSTKKLLNGVPLWKFFIDKDNHASGSMCFDDSDKYGNSTKGEPVLCLICVTYFL